MSTAALQNVWEGILAYNLSTANKRWLVERLWEQIESEDPQALAPYTMDEIDAMIDNAEHEIAAGLGIPDEEAWKELDEELAHKEELTIA